MAEADSALESRKKPPEATGPSVAAEGLVLDEWVRFFSLAAAFVVKSPIFDILMLLPRNLAEREKGKIPSTAAS